MARRLVQYALVGLTLAVASACYTYKPVEQPAPGAAVRAALTVEGAVRQSEFLGEPVRSLSGKFVSRDADAVRLDIITGASRGTFNNIVLRDTLAIPTDQIITLEEREISWVKTAIVFAAVATITALGVGTLTGGGEDIDTGNPPITVFEGIRIPVFRITR